MEDKNMNLDDKLKWLEWIEKDVSDLFEYTQKLKSDNQKGICKHLHSDITNRMWELRKALEKEDKDAEFNGWLERQRHEEEKKKEYNRGYAHGRHYG